MSKWDNGSREGRKRQKGIGAYTKRVRSRSSIVIYSSVVVSIISWQSGRRGSNPRPLAWKANALSTELLPHSLLEAIVWWAVMDSNHRRRKPAELQSAPFGHSGNCPFRFLHCKGTNYFSTVQIGRHIFSAVSAASAPLFPSEPPARSSACAIVSVVRTPKITGRCRSPRPGVATALS